jgi:hypothetical protein
MFQALNDDALLLSDLGVAIIKDGTIVIHPALINLFKIGVLTLDEFTYITSHELAHHTLNHYFKVNLYLTNNPNATVEDVSKFTLKVEAEADCKSIVDNNISIEVYYKTLSKLKLVLATKAYTVALKNRGLGMFNRFLYRLSAIKSYKSSLSERQKLVEEMFK